MKHRLHVKGQGMVEFALTVPVLLLLLLVIIELGHVLFYFGSVYAAAREGARFGAAMDDPVGAAPVKYLDQAGMRDAAKRIGFIAGLADDQIDIQYDCGVSTTRSASVPTCTTGVLRVAVTVNSTYESIVPIPPVQDFPISSTVVRTIVHDVGLDGNYPTRPAPTNTPAPDCADLTFDEYQYDPTNYPNWHVITIVAGPELVRMNSFTVSPKNPKRGLQWILYDPPLTDPNPDANCHTDETGCVLWFNGNHFDFDPTMGGSNNPPAISLEGRQVNDTMRQLFLRFDEIDYSADIAFDTWCGATTISIP